MSRPALYQQLREREDRPLALSVRTSTPRMSPQLQKIVSGLVIVLVFVVPVFVFG